MTKTLIRVLMSGGLIDILVFSVFRVSELQVEWTAHPPAACRSVTFMSASQQTSGPGLIELVSPPSGAELKLHSHPGRSASGFTTVQDLIPVENTQKICSGTCQTPPPPAHSTPVITGEPLCSCAPNPDQQSEPASPVVANSATCWWCFHLCLSSSCGLRWSSWESFQNTQCECTCGWKLDATSPDYSRLPWLQQPRSSNKAAPPRLACFPQSVSDHQAGQLSSEEQRSRPKIPSDKKKQADGIQAVFNIKRLTDFRNHTSKHDPSCLFLFSGNLEPVSPPDCQICRSQYKLIAELRGFMCVSRVAPPRSKTGDTGGFHSVSCVPAAVHSCACWQFKHPEETEEAVSEKKEEEREV